VRPSKLPDEQKIIDRLVAACGGGAAGEGRQEQDRPERGRCFPTVLVQSARIAVPFKN
jgi:hypothetical protein